MGTGKQSKKNPKQHLKHYIFPRNNCLQAMAVSTHLPPCEGCSAIRDEIQ